MNIKKNHGRAFSVCHSSHSGGKWVRTAKLTSNFTVQYRKSGLKSGTTYKFRVKTYKMSGNIALYSGYTYLIARTK